MRNFPPPLLSFSQAAWSNYQNTEKSIRIILSGQIVIDSFGRRGLQIDSDRITYGHFIGERFSPAGPTLKAAPQGERNGALFVLGQRLDSEGVCALMNCQIVMILN